MQAVWRGRGDRAAPVDGEPGTGEASGLAWSEHGEANPDSEAGPYAAEKHSQVHQGGVTTTSECSLMITESNILQY